MLNGRNELFLGFISKEKRNDKTRKDIESVFNIIQDKAFTNEIYYYDKEELGYWLKEVGKSSLKSIIEKNSLYSSEDIKKLATTGKLQLLTVVPIQKRINLFARIQLPNKSG